MYRFDYALTREISLISLKSKLTTKKCQNGSGWYKIPNTQDFSILVNIVNIERIHAIKAY